MAKGPAQLVGERVPVHDVIDPMLAKGGERRDIPAILALPRLEEELTATLYGTQTGSPFMPDAVPRVIEWLDVDISRWGIGLAPGDIYDELSVLAGIATAKLRKHPDEYMQVAIGQIWALALSRPAMQGKTIYKN